MMSENHSSVPGSPLPLSKRGFCHRAWVQNILAIATGSLFIALSFVVLKGLLLLQAAAEFTSTTFFLLAIFQLSLTTTGGYITALLASPRSPSSPNPRLTQHALGLATLAAALCLISALTDSGPGDWEIHAMALLAALIGICTGTWLRTRQRI